MAFMSYVKLKYIFVELGYYYFHSIFNTKLNNIERNWLDMIL